MNPLNSITLNKTIVTSKDSTFYTYKKEKEKKIQLFMRLLKVETN
jgi:hypothetical protein